MKLKHYRTRDLLRHPFGWIATGGGAGLAPKAPGTMGSIVALVPGYYLWHSVCWAQIAVIVFTFVIGVFAATWVIDKYKIEDPSIVVVDEFVGQWLTLLVPTWLQQQHLIEFQIPTSNLAITLYFLAALIAFRIIDIIKPWPVSWADRELKGGFGAMADDAIAGLAGAVLLALILHWFWP